MEYAILDELKDTSDERLQRFLEANPEIAVISKIEEAEEAFDGSDPNMKLYIFQNYMSRTGLMNLAIIIRELKDEEKNNQEGESDLLQTTAHVETSIFPLYSTKPAVFELPEAIEEPDIPRQKAQFIIEKRGLPKIKKGETFDCTKHRWNVNLIAEKLNMSNRIVARYCKSKGI